MTTYTYDQHRPPAAQVTAGLTSKAAKIRTLFRAGYSRQEIGAHLEVSPQLRLQGADNADSNLDANQGNATASAARVGKRRQQERCQRAEWARRWQ